MAFPVTPTLPVFPQNEYDKVCLWPGAPGVSRALREFTVPVVSAAAGDVRPMRGIVTVMPAQPWLSSQQYPGGVPASPDPRSSNGNTDDYRGAELGIPMSRFSLYYKNTLNIGSATANPSMNLEIRSGVIGAMVIRVVGVFSPKANDENGLVVQISGLNACAWEIWAGAIPGAGAVPVKLQLFCMIDWHDDAQETVIRGPRFPPP